MFIVIVYCKVRPERRSEFLAGAATLCEATRMEAGNLAYGCFEDPGNPGTMTFVEEWQTADAIAAHMAQPYSGAFLAAALNMLTEPPSIRQFEIARVESLI